MTSTAEIVRNSYEGVTTRFLRADERFVTTQENEMPLVIEAKDRKDLKFLQEFMKTNSKSLMEDAGKYGAVLFRGFDIQSDKDFESALTSIDGFKGISDAFMAEHGRERVDGLKYVLHTNTIYKTGGTLYLGGFHSENYYTADVPGFISFCCFKPSTLGGETGFVNMEKVYDRLDADLKKKLEEKPCFVQKWLVSDVAERYQIDTNTVEAICRQFDLPVVGEGADKLILMYKPSVFVNPVTHKKALAINMFSLPTLDTELRKYFLNDYKGDTWYWHRFVWQLPHSLFKSIENIFVFLGALIHSPKELYQISETKMKTDKAFSKLDEKFTKINACFNQNDINNLAREMHNFYCSILWQKGDILLADNKKTAHTGMPGAGPRTVRALISNLVQMKYSDEQSGCLQCQDSPKDSIGSYMEAARKNAAKSK